jgi:hypothetical protein
MSSTTTQVTGRVTPQAVTTTRRPVWKHGVAAAVAASAATTSVAAIVSAAGVSFSNGRDAGIPIAGFAQLTIVFSLIGVGIAAVLARKARRPRSTFLRTTVGLAVLSVVPDLTFGFTAGSAAMLVTLHTLAAVIVIPTLASRLSAQR